MSWRKCPRCNSKNVLCIDSRFHSAMGRCRRRYECKKRGCGKRFTTIEEIVKIKRGAKYENATVVAKARLLDRIDQFLAASDKRQGRRA